MNKEQILKALAKHGYNVGFGAKKNFASYDIVTKLPSWVSFLILAIGIIQLGYPQFATKAISIALILLSIAIIFVGFYNSSVNDFEEEGKRLTGIYNQLQNLYHKVHSSDQSQFTSEVNEMNKIMDDFYSKTISKQVFLSNWYAHFKFFYEMQIDWVDEQLKFRFFKDKFPNSLKSTLFVIIIIVLTVFINEYIRNL